MFSSGRVVSVLEIFDLTCAHMPVYLCISDSVPSLQVELASELTVLVGMNGAGLMNALYLPPHAVAVQLAPYNNTLNVVQFGEVLKARGPYMVWSNTHEENHFVSKHDVYSSRPDTLVHVEEFKQLMKDALVLAHESQTHMKDEL